MQGPEHLRKWGIKLVSTPNRNDRKSVEAMYVYEEIKNDPRAFIKQFAGLKRHTPSWDSGMCTHAAHDFGPVATGNFVTVPAGSVSTDTAFEICPNSGESIECWALWDKYLLTRVWNLAPWEAEDAQSVHTDDVTTDGYVMTQVDGKIAIFRVVEQDELNRVCGITSVGTVGISGYITRSCLTSGWLRQALQSRLLSRGPTVATLIRRLKTLPMKSSVSLILVLPYLAREIRMITMTRAGQTRLFPCELTPYILDLAR